MIMIRCSKCGELHQAGIDCPNPKRKVPTPNKIVEGLRQAVAHARCEAPETVIHTTDSERVAAWRAKNRGRYNEKMRAYRAKRKAQKEQG